MSYVKPTFLLGLFLFSLISLFAQKQTRPFKKTIIVKTNVLSFLALKPSISIEKPFTEKWSGEVSFVQGEFNNFLFTDHYDYNGFLFRLKKHFAPFEFGRLSPYVALYTGTLQRNIYTTGHTDNTGWFSLPSRNFTANSIRSGGSLGLSYISKSKIIIDGQSSLGYGRYIKLDNNNPNSFSRGYLDFQLWVSIGYCF